MSGNAARTPRQQLNEFWSDMEQGVERMSHGELRRQHRNSVLPLARIKRIMKIDDDVRDMMISADVPALLAKAAEMFIEEVTLSAWVHTDDSKRKTLQRNDVAHLVGTYEHLDFLIDILPKDEPPANKKKPHEQLGDTSGAAPNVEYVLQFGEDGVHQLVPVNKNANQSN